MVDGRRRPPRRRRLFAVEISPRLGAGRAARRRAVHHRRGADARVPEPRAVRPHARARAGGLRAPLPRR